METKKTVLVGAMVVVAALMMASVLAVLQSSRTISSHGSIRGVNVNIYSDSLCTQLVSSVDWGTIDNGSSTVKTVYIKNEGTSNMTLSLSNSTWVPSDADTYLTLTWNRESYLLYNGTSVSADLTLTVSPTFTTGTDFSFNVIITGTQS